MKKTIAFLIAITGFAFPCSAQLISSGFAPANPAGSGYTLTFSDSMDSLSSFDLTGSGAPGFNWYLTRFFGSSTTPATALRLATDGQGGVVLTSPDANGYQFGS